MEDGWEGGEGGNGQQRVPLPSLSPLLPPVHGGCGGREGEREAARRACGGSAAQTGGRGRLPLAGGLSARALVLPRPRVTYSGRRVPLLGGRPIVSGCEGVSRGERGRRGRILLLAAALLGAV